MRMLRTVVGAMIVCGGAAARADVDVRLSLVPAQGDDAPQIRATVIGADTPSVSAVTLTQTDATPPIEMTASRIVPYRDGGEPIAIAVVVEGHNLWMTDATLARVGQALDAIRDAGPPGSLGELVVYGNGVLVPVPMRDLRQLDRSALGAVDAYHGVITRDLASGIERAMADLRAVPAPRRALIVIGDGADTDETAAVTALAQLRAKLADEGIEVHAIFYENDDEDFEGDLALLRTLAPDTFVASSIDNLDAEARAITGELDRRFDVIFPGYDYARDVGFTWDGASHRFALAFGTRHVDDLALSGLTRGYRLAPRPRPRWPWLMLAAGVAAFVFAIAVAWRRRRERALATR